MYDNFVIETIKLTINAYNPFKCKKKSKKQKNKVQNILNKRASIKKLKKMRS